MNAGYRHEALLYAGEADFVHASLAFIDEGLSRGEPMLVVLDEDKLDVLRTDLGLDAERVTFADMVDVGANPARLIGFWHTFVTEHRGLGPIRGIGEPIYARRSAAELVECQLHESLVNIAFADVDDLWLLCPYDIGSLPDEVVAEALRSHPFIASGEDRRASSLYRAPDLTSLFAAELGDVPGSATRIEFGPADLARLRRQLGARASAMNFHAAQIDEVLTAVNEVATNAVEHGGGSGVVRIWEEDNALHFEVTDPGRFSSPLAGRIPPSPAGTGGRGLWIANQLCDLLQIRSSAAGTVVRGQIRRVGAR